MGENGKLPFEWINYPKWKRNHVAFCQRGEVLRVGKTINKHTSEKTTSRKTRLMLQPNHQTPVQ